MNFLEKSKWATQFKALLKEGLKIRKQALEKQKPFTKESQQMNQQMSQLENQLNQLVAQQINKQRCKKTFNFQKSIIKQRNHVFTFLYDLEVPPDNTLDKEEPIEHLVIWIFDEGSFVPSAKITKNGLFSIVSDYLVASLLDVQ